MGDPEAEARRLPLSGLQPGHCGYVREVRAGGVDVERLKAMGICSGRKVMLVRRGDPLILRVLGSRIGLSERLAARVDVEPCPSELCQADER